MKKYILYNMNYNCWRNIRNEKDKTILFILHMLKNTSKKTYRRYNKLNKVI